MHYWIFVICFVKPAMVLVKHFKFYFDFLWFCSSITLFGFHLLISFVLDLVLCTDDFLVIFCTFVCYMFLSFLFWHQIKLKMQIKFRLKDLPKALIIYLISLVVWRSTETNITIYKDTFEMREDIGI